LHWAHSRSPRRAGRAHIAQQVEADSGAIEVAVMSINPSLPTQGAPL
jgi:hypothetical protein